MERGEARGERRRDLRRKVVFGSIFIFLKKSGMVWSPPATIACSFLSPDTCSVGIMRHHPPNSLPSSHGDAQGRETCKLHRLPAVKGGGEGM